MEPILNQENDDEIELLADIRAHDRVPNPANVMDLSNEDDSVDGRDSPPDLKRPRISGDGVVLPEPSVIVPTSTDPSECQICLENYTVGGDRRSVVTKCGHIFCFYCIDKVRASGQPCPKCRKKLGKSSHLITLYDVNVTIADTTLLDQANKKLEDEKLKVRTLLLQTRISTCLGVYILSLGLDLCLVLSLGLRLGLC